MSSKLPTIIDNSGENSVQNALRQLTPICKQIDIGTGRFEIGAMLTLNDTWEKTDKIRILSGDETSRRTKDVLLKSIIDASHESIEVEKEINDGLTGLELIRDALKKRKIEVKIYTKARFHGKCYLMDTRPPSPIDFAIAGSSNFSKQGLTKNLELNLLSTDQLQYNALKKWYDDLWKEAEDVNEDILRVIEEQLSTRSPFTVYARALFEYHADKEKGADAWEQFESVIFRLLAKYQRDGYHRALQIAERWRGALVCDGVGLGKTFIGLMLLERYINEGKNVLLVVPKSAEQSVWRSNIDKYLKPKYGKAVRHYLDIKRHTDFGRDGGISQEDLDYFKKHAQAIIIDEAHHFRNKNNNRGKQLLDLAAGKELYMLTATPINNGLDDLYNLINYFAQNDKSHFSSIRIHDLRRHFLDNEKRFEVAHKDQSIADAADSEDFLRTDELLRHVLIQRSRKYVRDSESAEFSNVMFPDRQKPRVVTYSLKNVYSSLYDELKEAFDRQNPFLTLAIYNTSNYQRNPDNKTVQQQGQIIGLIRTLLLKRLESSYKAFEASVENLLAKMALFLKTHNLEEYNSWDHTNTRWWNIVQQHIRERLEQDGVGTTEEDDTIDDLTEEASADLFVPANHDMVRLVGDLVEDMMLLTGILSKIYRRFYHTDKEGVEEDPSKDGKWVELQKLLEEDPLVKGHKVLVFTEFRDTARYIFERIEAAGFMHVEIVDSGRNVENRERIIKRFAPYYNSSNGGQELQDLLANPINILVSTDVLSEGLNLQDASLIINYDLHWNPVRLMQRIGRVDRRLNPEIEEMIKRPASLKGKTYFWNFLPPSELEELLHLKSKLDGKILRISRTLGIESPIMTPDDEAGSLKLFNERYEGTESVEELLSLEKQRIEVQMQGEWAKLGSFPRRLFSGKLVGDGFEPILNAEGVPVANLDPNMKPGLFCCYRMPPIIDKAAKDLFDVKEEIYDPTKHIPGEVRWYFYDFESQKVTDDLKTAWTAIKCKGDTQRYVAKGVENLVEARKAVEKFIKNTYLKDVQTPIGAKPTLLAWVETSSPTA